jgi:hypothetical protein
VNQYIRPDSDGDGYCQFTSVQQCLGTTAPAGYRFSSACSGTDCKDNNPWATTTCRITNGYHAALTNKQCGIGPPQCENKDASAVDTACPTGFHPNYYNVFALSGSCTYVDPVTVNQCCAPVVFGTVQCHLYADCVAD